MFHYKICFVAFINVSIQICKQVSLCVKEHTTFVLGTSWIPIQYTLTLLLIIPSVVIPSPVQASTISPMYQQPQTCTTYIPFPSQAL